MAIDRFGVCLVFVIFFKKIADIVLLQEILWQKTFLLKCTIYEITNKFKKNACETYILQATIGVIISFFFTNIKIFISVLFNKFF